MDTRVYNKRGRLGGRSVLNRIKTINQRAIYYKSCVWLYSLCMGVSRIDNGM